MKCMIQVGRKETRQLQSVSKLEGCLGPGQKAEPVKDEEEEEEGGGGRKGGGARE